MLIQARVFEILLNFLQTKVNVTANLDKPWYT